VPPIAAYSQSVGQFLLELSAGVLSKPQRQHLVKFVLALIVGHERHTCSGQARVWHYDRVASSIKRFLTDAPWEAEKLARRVQVRLMVLLNARPDAPIELILDDTVCAKEGTHMEGCSRHYGDGRIQWGHCKVTLMVRCGTLKVPFAFRIYVTQAVCTAAGLPFFTKLELAQQMLAEFTPPAGRRVLVLFDSFYTSRALLRYVCLQRQWELLARIESNRQVSYRGRKCKVSSLVTCAGGPAQWGPLRLESHDFVGTRVKVTLWQGLPGSLIMTCDPAKPAQVHFYITNRRDWSAGTAARLYQHRWYIETYHRDVKQLLGLAHYQLRSLVGLRHYWLLVDLAYSVLRLPTCSAEAEAAGLTLGQLRQQVQVQEERRRMDAALEVFLRTGSREKAYQAAGCAA
jgi:hypothetical protein